MSLGDRLGWVGVILALIAIAAPYLWPDKRWIGWVSLCFAVMLVVTWGWLEFGAELPRLHSRYPIKSGIVVFVVGGCLALALWTLVTPRHEAKNVSNGDPSNAFPEGHKKPEPSMTPPAGPQSSSPAARQPIEKPKPQIPKELTGTRSPDTLPPQTGDPHDEAKWRLQYAPEKLTVRDLYYTDFSSAVNGSLHYGGFVLQNGETKSQTHIEYVVIRQMEMGSKFLAFYILYTNETPHICVSLADKTQYALGDWLEGRTDTEKIPGDSEQLSSKDLVFSKRVFIYHEAYLSPEQIIEIRNAYHGQGLSVILRGTDYLANKKLEAQLNKLQSVGHR